MKYFLFDVAGTLLHKPTFYVKVQQVLLQFGYEADIKSLKQNHKILSESIFFPDRTNADFYASFNREFLYALGIVPSQELVDAIFASCSYLPWEAFDDTEALKHIEQPMGIISNFNSTLREKLSQFFTVDFRDVFVSEELGVAKPSLDFYKRAVDKIGIDPKEITYVGDSVKLDLEPALKIGMQALLIDRENYFPIQVNRIKSLFELNKTMV